MGDLTGTSNETWWITDACTMGGDVDGDCLFERVRDENGIGTPHIVCQTHGNVVGHITWPTDTQEGPA